MPEQTRSARESESSATGTFVPGGSAPSGVLAAPPRTEHRPDSPGSAPLAETHIRPQTGCPSLDLADLWKCRDLIVQLTLRNIRVRYKQTVLGVLWAVIQPVSMMAVFVICIPRTAGQFPNSVFVLSGHRSRKVGTLADLNTFSFHPVKAITTGEGGMITTDNVVGPADGFARMASPPTIITGRPTASGRTRCRRWASTIG